MVIQNMESRYPSASPMSISTLPGGTSNPINSSSVPVPKATNFGNLHKARKPATEIVGEVQRRMSSGVITAGQPNIQSSIPLFRVPRPPSKGSSPVNNATSYDSRDQPSGSSSNNRPSLSLQTNSGVQGFVNPKSRRRSAVLSTDKFVEKDNQADRVGRTITSYGNSNHSNSNDCNSHVDENNRENSHNRIVNSETKENAPPRVPRHGMPPSKPGNRPNDNISKNTVTAGVSDAFTMRPKRHSRNSLSPPPRASEKESKVPPVPPIPAQLVKKRHMYSGVLSGQDSHGNDSGRIAGEADHHSHSRGLKEHSHTHHELPIPPGDERVLVRPRRSMSSGHYGHGRSFNYERTNGYAETTISASRRANLNVQTNGKCDTISSSSASSAKQDSIPRGYPPSNPAPASETGSGAGNSRPNRYSVDATKLKRHVHHGSDLRGDVSDCADVRQAPQSQSLPTPPLQRPIQDKPSSMSGGLTSTTSSANTNTGMTLSVKHRSATHNKDKHPTLSSSMHKSQTVPDLANLQIDSSASPPKPPNESPVQPPRSPYRPINMPAKIYPRVRDIASTATRLVSRNGGDEPKKDSVGDPRKAKRNSVTISASTAAILSSKSAPSSQYNRASVPKSATTQSRISNSSTNSGASNHSHSHTPGNASSSSVSSINILPTVRSKSTAAKAATRRMLLMSPFGGRMGDFRKQNLAGTNSKEERNNRPIGKEGANSSKPSSLHPSRSPYTHSHSSSNISSAGLSPSPSASSAHSASSALSVRRASSLDTAEIRQLLRTINIRGPETPDTTKYMEQLKLQNRLRLEPMTPAQASSAHRLNLYEKGEILDFRNVYFCGRSDIKKVTGDIRRNISNYGFDDEKGDYRVVEGDHIAYRYEILGVLGKGSFGKVLKCIDHKDGQLVALKMVINRKRLYMQALVESDLLRTLSGWDAQNRFHLVRYYDHFNFREHLCITTELLGMNLYELIKMNGYKGLPVKLVRHFVAQVLEALAFLDSKSIIHCDLKPENLMLCDAASGRIKLIDFGSSCYESARIYTYIQSRFYRSPEVMLGMPYGRPIDMWSLGCIMPELLTGVPLFMGENEQEQIACIMEIFGVPDPSVIFRCSRRRLFFDSQCQPRKVVSKRGETKVPNSKKLRHVIKSNDPALLTFLERMLTWDPTKRVRPDEALELPFFTDKQDRPAVSSVSSSTLSSSSADKSDKTDERNRTRTHPPKVPVHKTLPKDNNKSSTTQPVAVWR